MRKQLTPTREPGQGAKTLGKENAMSVKGASKRIESELSRWDGITTAPHRFGVMEFRLARREIGHIHGDSLVDIPLPKRIRDELVSTAQAEPHHVLPKSGWMSVHLTEPADVDRAIRILRRSFELAQEQRDRKLTP